MIELSNGNIALSYSNLFSLITIVIFDSSSYGTTTIELTDYHFDVSSLCISDENSFICVREGKFLQISNEEGSLLCQSEGGKFNRYNCIIPIEGGNYFVVDNGKKITIIHPCCK